MNINQYIQHPEALNRNTLYELRRFVALYPCHQAARLLLLQNLFLLHDPSFDDALRTAAFYITDRSTLFNIVEAHFYALTKEKTAAATTTAESSDATTIIDNFLDSVAPDDESDPKPSIVDATVDYMAYIMSTHGNDGEQQQEKKTSSTTTIIDSFLEQGGGKLSLADAADSEEEEAPHNDVTLENDNDDLKEGFYTESLAKIYIKQGNYSKALEIITQINLNNSSKNPYFADQKRYLEKIIAIKSKDKK